MRVGGRIRRTVTAAACLLGVALLLTRSLAATPDRSLRVLQMNLCDSGIAECYTGRSVAQAATLLRADTPDVVTLNEVCREDVSTLDRALSGDNRGGTVVGAFRAAGDDRTGGAFRCRNGEPYGIGLLVRLPASMLRYVTRSGIYPTQTPGDPEERAWLCIDVSGRFTACTTHLSNISPTVALAQCQYLWGTAIPAVRTSGDRGTPAVIGGDLNLHTGGSPDVGSCVPPGYLRTGDGGVQYVVATTDLTVDADRDIAMRGTTDHPGLLVSLVGIGAW